MTKNEACVAAVLTACLLAACESKTSSPSATTAEAPASAVPAPPPPDKPRVPVILARTKGTPKHVAVDASGVFVTVEDWSSDDLPTDIVRVPLAGGEPKLLASKQRGGQSLVATKDAVLWIAAGDADRNIPDAVMRAPLAGGAPTKVAKTFVFGDAGLAADASSVYFQDVGEKGSSAKARLMRVPLAGGSAAQVATFDDLSANVITVDAKNVYWTSLGAILKAPVGGGAVTTLVKETGVGNVWGIASDGTHLYWTDRGNDKNDDARRGAVRRVPVDGGKVETIASGLRGRPWGIALDETHVYWVINAERDGGIMRAPKAGGPASVVVGGQVSPVHLALDATHVYWANAGGDHAVSKASKQPAD